MGKYGCTAASLAAMAFAGVALAAPQADPVYTFCEDEGNDKFERRQTIDIDQAKAITENEDADDCTFITGKLQKDCAWDCEPKCALVAYDKPVQCYDSNGDPVLGLFAEPIVARSLDGNLFGVTPNDDGTIRLGVAATSDAFDFTVNGLAFNGPHGAKGEVTVKLFVVENGTTRVEEEEADEEYVFNFQNGSDALRVAFQIEDLYRGSNDPNGLSVDILCCEDTGTVEIAWDVDYYEVTGLEAGEPYCITVVGGLDMNCEKTLTKLGEFNKNGLLVRVSEGMPYAEICTFADDQGRLRFAISGPEDCNFNGFKDSVEEDIEFLELQLFFEYGIEAEYKGGSSTKDERSRAVRLPREVWEDLGLECGSPVETDFQHGQDGGYCIKIRRADHVDEPNTPPTTIGEMSATRADLDGSGRVDSADLALLLSQWGN